MPVVINTHTGEEKRVYGDSKRALLKVFLKEVVCKRTPNVVTDEYVEEQLPAYDKLGSFRTTQERTRDGTFQVYTEFWKYAVKEGFTKPS